MKIYSAYKDYYDYLQKFGTEPINYNRKTQIISINSRPEIVKEFSLINIDRTHAYPENLCDVFWIGYCGEMILNCGFWTGNDWEKEYFVGKAAEEKLLNNPEMRKNLALANIIRFLENRSPIFYPLFIKYKIPLFHLYSGYSVTFNPILMNILKYNQNEWFAEWKKEFPPEKIYQDLSCFLGNDLKEQMEMSAQTDLEKVISHGFDKKTSFRPKMKEKKK